ncbi:MAG: ATP-dependent DNA ligase [Patescibacteria group bacterium]|nr:ATP-dependent DNA ligase [Patescibacteria group bacterium]
MNFSELAKYLDQITKTSSRLKITSLLTELFARLSEEEIDKVVYLLQGRVVPEYESLEFGVSEKLVFKATIKALNVKKDYLDQEYKKTGDLGETVEKLKTQHQHRPFYENVQTITEVYKNFYRIASLKGEGSQEEKINLLSEMIRESDPLSARFLVRIPTGNFRMGFSEMTILDAFSWLICGDKSLRESVEKAYHVRPNLGYLGKLAKKKDLDSIMNIKPKLFIPIIMMKAERLSSAKEIIDKIGECVVEPKFDGFRLQIHYQKTSQTSNDSDKKIKIFSRSLEEVTFMFPDLIEAIKKQISAQELIFEGEAVGYDPDLKRFLPFQETVQRKRKYGIAEVSMKIPLRLFVFELLYKNHLSFLDRSFIERRKELEKSIITSNDPQRDIVLVTTKGIARSEEEIDNFFDSAIKKNLEGLMAKKIMGVYKPGSREWNWIKYKKSYSQKAIDTVDCVILGYDLGKGKRSDFGIGAFLVGIYDEKSDQFLTLAKIGTGLSDDEWRNLKDKLSKHHLEKKPKNYLVSEEMSCDFWIEPKIVVEIRSDGVTKSPIHTAGLALRFPRLERFREDKKFTETTKKEEILKIFR